MNQLPDGLAIVTGASSGIGEHFARQLAEYRHPLLLVARRHERLDALADELRRLHEVSVIVHPADLTEDGTIDDVMEAADATGERLGIVINNAGFGSDGKFHTRSREEQLGMVRLNVEALTALTHAALTRMVPACHGGVLNVASVVANLPAPSMAVYAASKAFVLSFTEAVAEEVRDSGVIVTALSPGATSTEYWDRVSMDASDLPDFLVSDPDRVAADGLDALARGEVTRVSGGVNKASVAVLRATPRRLLARIGSLAQK